MDSRTVAAVNETRDLRPPSRPRRRCLVVDDLPEIGMLFRYAARRIREYDVEMHTEVVSRRALDVVESEPFDLVVSDFRMREVDGVEVLSAARRTHPAGLRALATAYNEVPTSPDRLRGAAIDAYLEKPFDTRTLPDLLARLFARDAATLADLRSRARDLESSLALEEG